jgi:hypothetical protein
MACASGGVVHVPGTTSNQWSALKQLEKIPFFRGRNPRSPAVFAHSVAIELADSDLTEDLPISIIRRIRVSLFKNLPRFVVESYMKSLEV